MVDSKEPEYLRINEISVIKDDTEELEGRIKSIEKHSVI
jgi:hypothetical protein